MAEFMIEDKIYESFEEFYKDSGEKILEQRIYTMVLKCPYCDEYIHIRQFSSDKNRMKKTMPCSSFAANIRKKN